MATLWWFELQLRGDLILAHAVSKTACLGYRNHLPGLMKGLSSVVCPSDAFTRGLGLAATKGKRKNQLLILQAKIATYSAKLFVSRYHYQAIA
jgi:hypothetical protein